MVKKNIVLGKMTPLWKYMTVLPNFHFRVCGKGSSSINKDMQTILFLIKINMIKKITCSSNLLFFSLALLIITFSPIPNIASTSLEEANTLLKWKANLQIPNNSLVSSWINSPPFEFQCIRSMHFLVWSSL